VGIQEIVDILCGMYLSKSNEVVTMTRTYLWHKRPQRGKDIFVVHLHANVISPIDTQVSRIWRVDNRPKRPDLTDRRAPAASIHTSSSLSDSRVIKAPTTFLPCSNLRVDGSFCIRLDTATQAHLRSDPSGLSIWAALLNQMNNFLSAERHTFWMIGRIASFFVEADSADARP